MNAGRPANQSANWRRIIRGRRWRLKRRSAASTPKPLEDWTLLCEESLGKRVPAALRENGLTVVVQGELPGIPRGINDEDLARLAGPQSWILISKDLETRYRPNERIAIAR